MKDRFQEVAAQLGTLVPDVDDPLWNFYRLVGQGASKPVTIPVDFYKDGAPVATVKFRALPCPHQLNGLALHKSIEALGPRADWDSIGIGPNRLTRTQAEQWIANDPIAQAAKGGAPKSFIDVARTFALAAPGDGQARTDFVTGVALLAYSVELPHETIGQRVSRTWSDWQQRLGL
jgi:hypothetical protein